MVSDTTTYFKDLKTLMVIIKQVPCYKCSQCGEVAFDLAVGERIEEIVKSLKNAFTEIAVINYSHSAA
jgi:YgiT-type zinc finger domain-containing protein